MPLSSKRSLGISPDFAERYLNQTFKGVSTVKSVKHINDAFALVHCTALQNLVMLLDGLQGSLAKKIIVLPVLTTRTCPDFLTEIQRLKQAPNR